MYPYCLKDIERFEYKKFVIPNVFYNKNDVINKLKFYIENSFVLEKKNKTQYNKFFYEKEDIRKKLLKNKIKFFIIIYFNGS